MGYPSATKPPFVPHGMIGGLFRIGIMAFDDDHVATDPLEPPFAVRIEIRRRSPKSFEASNWIEIPMLFNHAGQVPVDLDRLYCIVASRLGMEMGS